MQLYLMPTCRCWRANKELQERQMQSSITSSLWGPDLGRHFRRPLAFDTVEIWSSFRETLTVLKLCLCFFTSPSEDTEVQELTRESFSRLLSSWFFCCFTYCRAKYWFFQLWKTEDIASSSAMSSICLKWKKHSMTTFFPYKNVSN